MRNGQLFSRVFHSLGFWGACLLLVFGVTPSALAQYDWRQMQGNLTAAAVATGGNATNLYVTVGDFGTVLTSPDGSAWTLRSTGTTEKLYGVAFGLVGNTTPLYLAVGNQGTVLQSSDGVSWIPQTPVTNSTLRGVIFANNQFAAFGDNGFVMLSSDGVTWQQGTTGTTNSVEGMSYLSASGLYVAVGAKGIFLTSPDGLTWSTSQTATTLDLNTVAYGSGVFAAAGANGTIETASFSGNFGASIGSWQTRSSLTSNNITSLIFDGTKFVGVTSSSETVLSNDGISWRDGDSDHWTDLNAVVFDSANTRYVAVGNFGINPLQTSMILTSTDVGVVSRTGELTDPGLWVDHASASTVGYNDITHNNAATPEFVAVGKDETISYSPDGVIWNVAVEDPAEEQLNKVYSTGSRTVAVGNGVSGTSGIPPIIDWSDDGVNWFGGDILSFNGNTSLTTFRNLLGVTNNGTIWLGVTNDAADAPNDATAEGSVVTSTDGVTWNAFAAQDNSTAVLNGFLGVVWEPVTKLFVAILGPSSSTGLAYYHVRTSPDGINWSNPLYELSSVAFTNIRLVNGQVVILKGATAAHLLVLTPTLVSGVEKLVQVLPEPFISTGNALRDITYGPDSLGAETHVITGDDIDNDIDSMFTSNDLTITSTTAWNSLNPNASNVLQALDVKAGVFAAVGDDGDIFISRPWAPSISAPVVNEGGVLSGNATLTVQPLPFQPSGFLTYQWQAFNSTTTTWSNVVNGAFNGTTYAGNTTALLSITNITLASVVPYRVEVTNGNGTMLISNNATVTLGVSPVINQPPVAASATAGGSVTFSVVASGTPTPVYQWRRNGVQLTDDGGNVTGSNTSTLVLADVQLAGVGADNSAGNFSVDVTNIVGTVSAGANLTVGSVPVMVLQPVGQNPVINGTVVFSASASASPTPTYQWFLNGVALVNGVNGVSGANTSTLTINPVTAVDFGNYTEVATNSVGNVTSNTATFLPTIPLITIPPVGQTAVGGATVTINATGVGLPTLAYQWLVNGVVIPNGGRFNGATTPSLVITSVQGSDAGNYTLQVSNSNGNVTSTPALLQISASIGAAPSNQTVTVGDNAKLTVAADGSGTVLYQWYFNGVVLSDGGQISGSTTPTLNISSVNTGDAGNYTVQVSNGLGNVTSIPAFLTVLSPSAVRTGMDWREMDGELNAVTTAAGGNSTNRYVAVGAIGTLLTSPDGGNWTIRSTGTTQELYGVTFGLAGGTTPLYLAVGNEGLILQSNDGQTWIPQTPVTNSTLRGVIYANNEFVAFGDAGLVMSSPDGVTWTQGTTGTANSVRGMAYLPALSEFVAVGDDGLFLTSVNGLAWALGQTGATVNLNSVAFGNNLFVAVGDSGNIETASFGGSNGGNWQARQSGTANNIKGVVFDGTRFVGVTSSSETVVSTDGVTWARGDTGFYTDLTALAYDSGNSLYIAVGNIGINPLGTSYILTSTDANTWVERASAQTTDLTAVTHGLGVFVAVGANESIDTSPDGSIWTVHIRSLDPETLNDVTFGSGEFMTVGNGVAASVNAVGYRSFDGVNWSFMNLPTTNNLHGVAKGPGSTWVAVGEAAAEGNSTKGAVVLTSTNQGSSWSLSRMSFNNPFLGIVYDEVAGQYVAILGPATSDATPSEVIAISPDAQNWTFIYSTTAFQFARIERTNGFNVVVGTSGKIFVVDPAAVSVTVPFTSTANPLHDVTYGQDAAGTPTWVVVGDDTANDIDAMFTNTANNPATSSWNSLDPLAFGGLEGMDYSNGTFVAVGDNGRVFISKAWAPSIGAVLGNQTGVLGGNATFAVEPEPSAPANYLAYQWQGFNSGNSTWSNLTNGSIYSGVTGPLLTVENITNALVTPYRVLLTGNGTTLISNNATIDLSVVPAITTPPVSANVTVGGNVTFSAAASGSPAPTFSWQQNGVLLTDGPNVQGSNTSTLILTNVQLSNTTLPNSAGIFTVTATNSVGSASASATLTVNAPPVIVTPPVSQLLTVNGTVTFSVGATGFPAVSYQWYFNGTALANGGSISGAQSSNLTISPEQLSNQGYYDVVVSNVQGNVTSAPVVLGNTTSSPIIFSQSANVTVSVGGTVNLSVVAVGAPPPTFQWYLNGKAINNNGTYSGATSAMLSITGITATQGGNYTVTVTSGNTTLTGGPIVVTLKPTITGQPVNQTVIAFSTVRFTVTVVTSGTKAPTYQWYFQSAKATTAVKAVNKTWMSGATTATLKITHAGAQYIGSYYVVVTNPAGTVTSKTVTLKMKPRQY